MPHRTPALITVLLGLFLLWAVPATAAPAWLPPDPLSPEASAASSDAPTTSVAVAADGTAVAVLTRQSGSGRVLEVARRNPGGSFAAIASPAAGAATSAEVGIDANGDATVVWQEGTNTIRAARLPADGSFETPQTLSFNGRSPGIAVGAGGTAVAVYLDAATTQVAARIRAIDELGATFADAALISPVGSSFGSVHGAAVADLAVAPDGRAAVAWSRYDGGAGRYLVEAAGRAPGDPFGGAQLLSDEVDGVGDENKDQGVQPAVTIDGQGRTVVAWTHDADRTDPNEPLTVHAARSPLTDQPIVASRDGAAAAGPDVAAAGGDVVLAWAGDTNPSRRIEATTCGGTPFDCAAPSFSSPTATGDTLPVVAGNAAGAALVAWHGFGSEGVYGAFKPAGGTFGAVLPAETNASEPSLRFSWPALGLDDEGNGTALWTHIRLPVAPAIDSAYSVRAAGFDAAAPALTGVSVPGEAAPGAAVAMSAAATDRWGPVTLTWAFGDGGTAAGGAVEHAFGAAGPFDVTVTATDAAGNAAGAVRRLTVVAPPPPAPPPQAPPAPPAPFVPPAPAVPATPRVVATVALRWRVRGPVIKLERMRLSRMPAGATAELRCAGRRCPIRRTAIFSPVRGAIDVVKPLDVDQRRFRAGQRLDLRITAPGHIGQVLRFNLRAGRQPQAVARCIPLGGTAVRPSC